MDKQLEKLFVHEHMNKGSIFGDSKNIFHFLIEGFSLLLSQYYLINMAQINRIIHLLGSGPLDLGLSHLTTTNKGLL